MKNCCDKCIELDPVYNDKCQAGCYQKVFSNDYFWAWNCFDRKFEKRPEVDLVINFFLYKSINVYWPNGLAPTQYTDFDFYSSTSGKVINQWKNSNFGNHLRVISLANLIFFQWRHFVFCLFLFASFNVGIDVFASLESLFKTDHVVNTIDNHLDQWKFRETKTISIGNIEHTTFGGCINTT